jgi:hypothetical protein
MCRVSYLNLDVRGSRCGVVDMGTFKVRVAKEVVSTTILAVVSVSNKFIF